MLNSIIERHKRLHPLSETEIRIVRSATKLFLENGFSKTTHRMIAEETGIGLGTITYHFKTKEELLELLIEELMDFHFDIIEEYNNKFKDNLFSYTLEIVVQIALCENNEKAWDLYYSAYSHRITFDFIKSWAAKKNYFLLSEKLPNLNESDFNALENITSGIELAAFTFPCDRYFTLDDKIRLILDSLLKIYDISENERKEAINKVLALEYDKIAMEMFDKFANRLD